MFSRIRKHCNATIVVAVFALVFAMTGGAFAINTHGGGSPSKAGRVAFSAAAATKSKPKGKRGPRGPAGPAGKNGANGATGPAGPAGPTGPAGGTGPTGAAGTDGTNGEKGTPGAPGRNGEKGEKGETGSPWTAGGTLPKGSTETGEWSVRSTAAAAGELRTTTISFPIPLASVSGSAIYVKAGESTPESCAGNAEKPGADAGFLCIFEIEATGKPILELIHKGGLAYAGAVTSPIGNSDAGTTGGELIFQTETPKTPGEEVSNEGTFAVTG
jgi:hypothetical protein